MIHLSPEQKSDLRLILDINPQKLANLAKELNETSNLLKRAALSDLFEKHISSDQAKSLESVAIAVAVQSDRPDETLEDVLDALEGAISEEEFGGGVEKFKSLRPYIVDVVTSESFYCSIKSAYLNSILDRHIHRFKIVVSARPIFDDTRNSVFSTVLLSNVSIITSDAAEQEHHLTFAVGRKQLKQFKDECERALAKLEILKGQIGSSTGGKVWLHGDDND